MTAWHYIYFTYIQTHNYALAVNLQNQNLQLASNVRRTKDTLASVKVCFTV